MVEAVKHIRTVMGQIRNLSNMPEEELMTAAKEMGAPFELVKQVAKTGKLPVLNFAAGGIATPADAALLMQLGCDGVFVGSGIFKSEKPEKMARAIVQAVRNYDDPDALARISEGLGEAMQSLEIERLEDRYAERGW